MTDRTTYERIADIVAEVIDASTSELTPETLWNECGADDLDLVEIWLSCEREFSIEIAENEVQLLLTIGELAELIDKKVKVSA